MKILVVEDEPDLNHIIAKHLQAEGYIVDSCHHTYNEIEGLDYQILVEADFLVNLFEDGSSREAAQKVQKNIFKTNTGTKYLSDLFLN